MKELTELLIKEIGLDVDKNGFIIDQDYGNQIIINGKKLKYCIDNVLRINPVKEIEFNPMKNSKLMYKLFLYYLEKLNEYEDRYFPTFYSIPGKNNNYGKFSMCATENNGYTYETRYYYNECLRYLELILIIGGYTNIDFSNYDYNEMKAM